LMSGKDEEQKFLQEQNMIGCRRVILVDWLRATFLYWPYTCFRHPLYGGGKVACNIRHDRRSKSSKSSTI
jgi:hypothetical protein